MIRGLLLLALINLAFCGFGYYYDGIYAPVNWYEQLDDQVDCASYCKLNGNYAFMRDWVEFEEDFVEATDIFQWDIDGPPGDFWEDDCADEVWFLKYGWSGMDRTECNRCRPQWVYSYVQGFNYDAKHGRIGTGGGIRHAYPISENAWEDWCDVAVSSRNSGSVRMYDQADGMLLAYPMGDVSDLTTRFSQDHYVGNAMIGNYEPNYCTAAIPFSPQQSRARCLGKYDDDSENVAYPTYLFCETWGWDSEYLQADYGCVSGDDCDSIEFEDRRAAKKQGARLFDARNPMPTMRKTSAESKMQSKRDNGGRGFNPTVGFQDQNFVASVAEPFCSHQVKYDIAF